MKTPSNEDTAKRVSEIFEAVRSFETNLASVKKLLWFDHDVLDIAISHVDGLHKKLVASGYENPALNAKNTLAILRGIKDHDSLLPRYKIIFNQAVVLLVSYFGSAIEELFKIGVAARLVLDGDDSELLREEVKFSFRKIRERGWDLENMAADLLVEKKDLTFQDMKSVADAFQEYIGLTIKRDKTVNNIIVAQACRHVIVHAGNEVTPKLMYQIRGASPRDLKLDIAAGELVQFTPREVETVSESMGKYVTALADMLRSRV